MLVIAAMAWGCGGGSGGGSSSSSSPTAPSTTPAPQTILIIGQSGKQAFSPNPAAFGGQSVVFKNNHTVTHRVVLNDGSIDTGDIAPGATSKAVTMPGSGTNYHCSIHPGMIGGVDAATGAPAPACEGTYCTPY